jgi:hypothetical protein
VQYLTLPYKYYTSLKNVPRTNKHSSLFRPAIATLTPGINDIRPFSSSLKVRHNKLVCLYRFSLSSYFEGKVRAQTLIVAPLQVERSDLSSTAV